MRAHNESGEDPSEIRKALFRLRIVVRVRLILASGGCSISLTIIQYEFAGTRVVKHSEWPVNFQVQPMSRSTLWNSPDFNPLVFSGYLLYPNMTIPIPILRSRKTLFIHRNLFKPPPALASLGEIQCPRRSRGQSGDRFRCPVTPSRSLQVGDRVPVAALRCDSWCSSVVRVFVVSHPAVGTIVPVRSCSPHSLRLFVSSPDPADPTLVRP